MSHRGMQLLGGCKKVSLHCFLVEEGALVAAENVGVADHSLLDGELTVARLDSNPSWSGRGTWGK